MLRKINVEPGRIFLNGQRFRVVFPRTSRLVNLALTERDVHIGFRGGQNQSLVLTPEGLTLEIIGGPVELVKDKSTRGEMLGYRAQCHNCKQESKRYKIRGVHLDRWAATHRCKAAR